MPGRRSAHYALTPTFPGVTISGAYTPDLSSGLLKNYTITGDVQMQNPTNNPGTGQELVMSITQDGTGGHRITSWGSWFWGSIPRISRTANSQTILRFVQTGNAWLCVNANLPDAWSSLSFVAGVTADYGAPFAPAAAKLDSDGFVHLRGAIQALAAVANNAAIATLPTAMSPSNYSPVTVVPSSTSYGVSMGIQPSTGAPANSLQSPGALVATQFVQLDGVIFPCA